MSSQPSSESAYSTPASPDRDDDLRRQAVKRLKRGLKKRRDFRVHLIAYVVVNAVFAAIWLSAGGGFLWPAFIVGIWGLGVVLNGWEAYRGEETFSEDAIQCEMELLRRR